MKRDFAPPEMAAPGDQPGAKDDTSDNYDGDIVPREDKPRAPGALMHVSVFPDRHALSIKRLDADWENIAQELTNPDEWASKHACPLFKLARFGDAPSGRGCLRHEGNLHELYGVIGDYDAEEVTLAQAADRLAAFGIEAVIYTSASNGVVSKKSNGGPRWRVVAPLSRSYPPAEHERLLSMIDEALGSILANESYTKELAYYFGRVQGVPFEARRVRGMCVDEMEFLFTGVRVRPTKDHAAAVGMPDLLPDEELPALADLPLSDNARAFLTDGTLNATGDRSRTLTAATASLYEAIARQFQRQDDAMVLSMLVSNTHAWGVACDKWSEDRALEYLWRHHCLKQRGKGVPDFGAIETGAQQLAAQRIAERIAERLALPKFERNQDSGAIKATKQNITWALVRPDLCGYQLRHDTFRGEVMIAPADGDGWRPFRDTDYHELCIRLESGLSGFMDIPKEKIRDAVAYIAEGNAFDSAQHWLGLQAWDGEPRVERFLPTYFGTEDTPYTRAVSLYLWTALAGRVLEPGIKADMVPAAVGRQGAGKSRTVAAIVPAADFFLELDLSSKDDDLARLMRGKLVIELGELKGLRAKEVEHIKAFITRQHEEWVPKYREMNVRYARRGIFFATTNQDEFLSDETGNRRWLPFRAGECDPDGVAANRGQLWAEARELFRADGVVWQDAERLATAEHDAYVVRDSWEPIVRAWLEECDLLTGTNPGSRAFLQTHEVLCGALQLNARNITRREETRIGGVLRKLGFVRERRRVEGVKTYVYERPVLPGPTLDLP